MSGERPFSAKIVSPAKCHEKPWDLWIGEIGHRSPRADDGPFAAPVPAEGAARRAHDAHPYKGSERARRRRAPLHRLRRDTMSLHGLFPQLDDLGAAVCHLCGAVVKCSAAYRHLAAVHAPAEPLLPPPPPQVAPPRARSRHKKEQPSPCPAEPPPPKRVPSPALAAIPATTRPPLPPPPRVPFAEDSSPAPAGAEVQVCVESGELPVVSIQDPEDLRLGETLTDDIFAIMNSEGIQSADDITNSADWKNIIRDIGNLQDLNFPPSSEVAASELYPGALHAPYVPDAELTAALQYAAAPPPPPPEPLPPPARPPPPAPPTPSKAHSRSKSGKTKFNLREYDPNKHCGVVTADGVKPCTRSLTCKAHALSLRRLVEGRAKPFDTLLAEHRASREAAAGGAAAPASAPPPAPAPAPAPLDLPLLVDTSLELAFNGLTAEQQVSNIYASLLSAEDPVLPDTSSITSLLSQPAPGEPFAMPDVELPAVGGAGAGLARDEAPPDVWWYAASPRPLALCTYNARHAGSAVALGRRCATVRSDIKSSLSRSQCKAGVSNDFYYGQNALALSKSVHMNAGKGNKPEVRRLIVTCGEGGARRALGDLLAGERLALNGHVARRAPAKLAKGGASPLDLGFALDPLLADEKC